MLIEDFLAETSYIIPAIKNNHEGSWNYLSNHFELFKKHNLLAEYNRLQGFNHTYLALAENLEKIQNEFRELIKKNYEE